MTGPERGLVTRRMRSWLPASVWSRVVLFLVGSLLVASGFSAFMNDLTEKQRRDAVITAIAQEIGQFYVIGAESTIYPELRSSCQKHREQGLLALRVLDVRGQLLNQYPRDFRPGSRGKEVAIQPPDGIVRGYLVAHHAPIPPGIQWPWFVSVIALEMVGLFIWQFLVAEVARKDAELTRINALSSAFRALLSKEGGEVANATQAIEGYRLQLQASLRDIVHDATKVPLIAGNEPARIEDLLKQVPGLSETPEGRALTDRLGRFLEDVRASTVTIRWILDGLPLFASHETEPVHLDDEFRLLLANLPPRLREPARCKIDVPQVPRALVIRFNRVHFRSVLKNALYNATRAIEKIQEEDVIQDREPTPGYVRIHVLRDRGRIGVCLEDNGTGLSSDALVTLYRPGQRRAPSQGHGSDIVEAFLTFHGAEATVENRPDPERGARVTFWFDPFQT